MPHRRPLSDKEALRRERPWVFAGGATLAGVAGFINVCLLGFFHVPVSRMSGAVSRLGGDVASLYEAVLGVSSLQGVPFGRQRTFVRAEGFVN